MTEASSSRRRVIGVGMDYSASSKAALRWAVDNLVETGQASDRLIIIDVQPKSKSFPVKNLWGDTGAPLIPLNQFVDPNTLRSYGLSSPDTEVIDILENVSPNKKSEVYIKLYWGHARPKLCDAVEELRLDSIVVGSRRLGRINRFSLFRSLLGSVSDYVARNATCTVTVVKASRLDTGS